MSIFNWNTKKKQPVEQQVVQNEQVEQPAEPIIEEAPTFIDPSSVEKPIMSPSERREVIDEVRKQQSEQHKPDNMQPIEKEVVKPEPKVDLSKQYVKHNRIYFYRFKYENDRLSISTSDSGFLLMPVPDSQLNFGHIQNEIATAKQEFVQIINQSYPGLSIPLDEIKIDMLNLVIEGTISGKK